MTQENYQTTSSSS